MVGRIAIITARTRVHRCYKHERAGISYGVLSPADGYLPVLKRLAKYFQSVFVELRKLITEENSVMSKGYFAGHWVVATTDKSHL